MRVAFAQKLPSEGRFQSTEELIEQTRHDLEGLGEVGPQQRLEAWRADRNLLVQTVTAKYVSLPDRQ
jgi:hypothetical protein